MRLLQGTCLTVSLIAAAATAVAAQDPGTSQSQPSGPAATAATAPALRLEDLPLKESVSQYGITWTFEKPARVGQFVNGDWYVVGPVTVTAITPGWGRQQERFRRRSQTVSRTGIPQGVDLQPQVQ